MDHGSSQKSMRPILPRKGGIWKTRGPNPIPWLSGGGPTKILKRDRNKQVHKQTKKHTKQKKSNEATTWVTRARQCKAWKESIIHAIAAAIGGGQQQHPMSVHCPKCSLSLALGVSTSAQRNGLAQRVGSWGCCPLVSFPKVCKQGPP